MSSCAASCCTCFPKASSASATSDSWPIASVPSPCHSAFPCSARQPKPCMKLPPTVRAIFGSAPIVVGRCASSNDSRLPIFNYAPLLSRSRLPHEATIHITNALGASALFLPLCPFAHKIPPSRSLSSSTIGQLASPTTFSLSQSSVLPHSANSARPHPHTPDHSFPIDARVCRNHGRPRSNGFIKRAQSGSPNFAPWQKRASDKPLALLRWDEKAGLRGMRYAPSCSTCSRHKEKETGNAEA